jgi:hypothetical protein
VNPYCPQTILVSAEAGVGKTRAVIESIAGSGKRVAFFGPTHCQLEEVREQLAPGVDALKLMRVSSETCAAGKHRTIERLNRQGVNPHEAVCQRCPLRPECPYAARYQDVERATVALYPSACLKFGKRFFEGLGDRLLVVDEDPTQYLSPTLTKTRTEIAETIALYAKA